MSGYTQDFVVVIDLDDGKDHIAVARLLGKVIHDLLNYPPEDNGKVFPKTFGRIENIKGEVQGEWRIEDGYKPLSSFDAFDFAEVDRPE